MKASIRAGGSTRFASSKRQFGFVESQIQGAAENDNQLAMLLPMFQVDQMIRQWGDLKNRK